MKLSTFHRGRSIGPQHGFTLLELLVAMVLSMIIFLAVIGAFVFLTMFFLCGMLGVGNFAWTVVLAFPIAAALTALNGAVVARLIYRPLLRAGRLNTLIGAIGLSMLPPTGSTMLPDGP